MSAADTTADADAAAGKKRKFLLGDILGIFWGYLWDVFGISWGYLGDILGNLADLAAAATGKKRKFLLSCFDAVF